MPIREFLRGGYQRITEPTVVSNHGRPIFTVMPSWYTPAPVARADGGPDASPKATTAEAPEGLEPESAREALRQRRREDEAT